MNKLVEYLAEHHHPGGNSFKIVPVTEIIEHSGLTVEEVHIQALEAYEAKMVIFVSNILLTTYGLGAVSIVAAFIVSSPYLVGFYYHHIITLRKTSAENT